jgi:hypothetical protein
VVQSPLWGYVLFVIAVGAAIWGFISLTKFQTDFLSRKTYRTAENYYQDFADWWGKQRRYAREHGGEWQGEEGSSRGPEDNG